MAENDRSGDGGEGRGDVSLENKGILFLTGEVSFESVNPLIKSIVSANMEPKTDSLKLIISSPGGVCDAGFSLIDVMEWSRIPIHTVALGEACSMGIVILMSGIRGTRQCSRNTTLMSHRFWGINGGNYSDLLAHRAHEDRLHQQFLDHYLRHTKMKNAKEVERILLKDVDNWISPQDAVKYGIVDTIIGPHEGFVR